MFAKEFQLVFGSIFDQWKSFIQASHGTQDLTQEGLGLERPFIIVPQLFLPALHND
jgi:hypothetical protein